MSSLESMLILFFKHVLHAKQDGHTITLDMIVKYCLVVYNAQTISLLVVPFPCSIIFGHLRLIISFGRVMSSSFS